jgi:hypothetical protein
MSNKKLIFEMKQHQIIQSIFDRNPRGRTIAQIARHFGLAESTVYKWQQDPTAGGFPMPGKYIIGFTEYTGDPRLLEWLAINCGYELQPIEDYCRDDDQPINRLLEISRLQGQLSEVLSKYVGKDIPQAEKPRMAHLLDLIQQEVRQFSRWMLRDNELKKDIFFEDTTYTT